jgi:hypothetical protein
MSIKPYIVEFEKRLLMIASKNETILKADIQRKKGIIKDLNGVNEELATKYERELTELEEQLSEWQIIIDDLTKELHS